MIAWPVDAGDSRRAISIERSEILGGSEAASDARISVRLDQCRFFDAAGDRAWKLHTVASLGVELTARVLWESGPR